MTIKTKHLAAGFSALGLATGCTPAKETSRPLEAPYDVTVLDSGTYMPSDLPGVTLNVKPYKFSCENSNKERFVRVTDAVYDNQLDAVFMRYTGTDGEEIKTSLAVDMDMVDLTEMAYWACTEDLDLP